MTFGQFFLGLVTILVATVVYRWQKGIDRQTELIRERRSIYARYLGASKGHMLSQPYKEVEYSQSQLDAFFQLSSNEAKIYSLRDEVYLVCTAEVRVHLVEFDRRFRAWKSNFPGADESDKAEKSKAAYYELQGSHNDLIESMRLEIQQDGFGEIVKSLKRFISGFLKQMRRP